MHFAFINVATNGYAVQNCLPNPFLRYAKPMPKDRKKISTNSIPCVHLRQWRVLHAIALSLLQSPTRR